jgi:hypothetical protein
MTQSRGHLLRALVHTGLPSIAIIVFVAVAFGARAASVPISRSLDRLHRLIFPVHRLTITLSLPLTTICRPTVMSKRSFISKVPPTVTIPLR